jgi:hypothetical protein
VQCFLIAKMLLNLKNLVQMRGQTACLVSFISEILMAMRLCDKNTKRSVPVRTTSLRQAH